LTSILWSYDVNILDLGQAVIHETPSVGMAVEVPANSGGIAFHAKPLVKESARQSISNLGLDGILCLIGLRDRETVV